MSRSHRLALLAIVLGMGGALVAAAGPPAVYVGHFSADSPSQTHPEGWQPIRFGNNDAPTTYDLVRTDSTVVLRARSENGASGLITHQRVDLSTHPVIEWRWRIESVVDGGDVTTKRGEVHPSPYTDQTMMLPVRSGSTRVGKWGRERRNVRADYREAFGEAPPPVAGVVLMTDTDHTGDSTQALYGDIVFRSAPETTSATPTDLPSGGES